MPHPVRINKLLSQLGIASRRRADLLIKNGCVSVNGTVLKKLGTIVDVGRDKISVYGKEVRVSPQLRHVYYLLNKPKGYLSTVKDTHNRKTVMDLVPKERGLFPVGRLDKDTSGLMLITNDGELAHRLMHPRYESDKVYQVQTNRALSDNDISRLKKGVDIGDRHLSVCEVLKVIKKIDKTEILLRLHEGRKRQIRRTFEAMGTVVDNLKRIRYCGLDIGNMKEGAFRILTDDELNYIRRKVGLR